MSSPSLKAKKNYFAKVRRANYVASLRLEGFKVSDDDMKVMSRKDAVLAHSRRFKTKT
ncbi:MAG: YhfG family protein [Pseudomonadales bacterium]|nr:YhfG family protein [Pseudomonadales bacterium]